MPHLSECPFCGGKVYSNGKHRCGSGLTTRQAWRALQNADAEHVDKARAEFVLALRRVGT